MNTRPSPEALAMVAKLCGGQWSDGVRVEHSRGCACKGRIDENLCNRERVRLAVALDDFAAQHQEWPRAL